MQITQEWTSEVGICWLLLEAAASGATGRRPGGFESSWLELGLEELPVKYFPSWRPD